MKKTEKKALKAKLLSAFKKTVKDNKVSLSKKTERSLAKFIKKIVKKTSQKRTTASKSKMHDSVVQAHVHGLRSANGVRASKQKI